jgi:glycosyltransferase involved in cell wall biosynthesis
MKITVIAGLADSLINFRGPLLRELTQAGHEVTALAPGGSTQLGQALSLMGVAFDVVDIERNGMNPLKDIRALLQLWKKLRVIKPDIILAYTIKAVIYGCLAAVWAGVPHIYSMITGLGYAFTGRTWRQRLVKLPARFLYRLSLARNEKVFFQNSDDAAEFTRLGLVKAEQTVLINGSGVDLDHFASAPHNNPYPSFLLIARLLRDKGVFEYVEAAKILKKRHIKAIFRLLGPFDSNPSAISVRQIREWERDGAIEYLRECEDVRPYITAASVYVLPSYREGTPRTVLEAMSMGRPIVTTDAPGCRETVVEGENGFLVSVGDASALADAMEKFIQDPAIISSMGRRSREIAEEKYDVRKVNRVIMKTMGLIEK